MRKAIAITLLLAAVSLSACSKKEDTSQTDFIEETAETEDDKFSLGGVEIDVKETTAPKETEPAKEVEVVETFDDGSYTAKMSDDSVRTFSSAKGLPEVDKLNEGESVTMDAIIGNWNTDSSLSVDYLKDNITTKNFPSLSDTDCRRIIEKAQERNPHKPEETEVYVPDDSEVDYLNEDGVYIDPETGLTYEEALDKVSKMSDEELDKLLKEFHGN